MSDSRKKNILGSAGFLKTTGESGVALTSEQKAALNRRGNELFNSGDIEAAKRIFMTTGYSDGLTRVGDYYAKESRDVEALQMYWRAHNRRQAEPLIERLSAVISAVLAEGGPSNGWL